MGSRCGCGQRSRPLFNHQPRFGVSTKMKVTQFLVFLPLFFSYALQDGEVDTKAEAVVLENDGVAAKNSPQGKLLTANPAVNGALVGVGVGVLGSLLVGSLLNEKNNCNYRGKRDTPSARFLSGKKCPPPPYNSGYRPPAPGYHPPAPGYHQPAPVYHQPAPVYHQPAPIYKQPSPGYNPPNPGYNPPNPGYNPPNPGYNPPQTGYQPTNYPPAPNPGYTSPTFSSGHTAPIGRSAPKQGAKTFDGGVKAATKTDKSSAVKF